MAQPAEDTAIWLPQPSGLLDRQTEPIHIRLDHPALGVNQLGKPSGTRADPYSPHRRQDAFDHDRKSASNQEPYSEPGEVDLHSLGSPSSIAATGAIATTWSSGAMRITITPCVWRPI